MISFAQANAIFDQMQQPRIQQMELDLAEWEMSEQQGLHIKHFDNPRHDSAPRLLSQLLDERVGIIEIQVRFNRVAGATFF